ISLYTHLSPNTLKYKRKVSSSSRMAVSLPHHRPTKACHMTSRTLPDHDHLQHTHSHAAHPHSVAYQLLEAIRHCEQRGTRLTPIRQHVLTLLLEAGRSLKAYELLEAMKQLYPQAKPPTVYRALDFLVEEGLIHRLDAVNAWT